LSSQRERKSHFTVLLITLATLSLFAATPAAASHSFVIPADENGCGADLQVEAVHLADRAPDSDRDPLGYGDITFTNLETGATYLQRSRYQETVTFDVSTDSFHITITGRIWMQVYPGEQGPSGVVQEPGLELLTDGKLEYTLGSNDVLTAFSLEGTYIDLCAELSS
jgi:hypothetical protein